MATENFSLHKKNQADAIWNEEYKTPLQVSEQDYKIARTSFLFIRDHWSKYVENLFGGGDLLIPSAVIEFENAKQDYVDKGMTYASALFSAMNSPFNLLKAYTMQLKLREVVCELEKLGSIYYSPSQKEVMIAFMMKLRCGLHGNDSNKEYYGACAVKYVDQVLADANAPLATRMLTLARAVTVPTIPYNMKVKYVNEVLDMLSEIYNDSAKIIRLEQDWKTYIRLARMMFAWKYMFFGLRHDRSKGLHVKSYAFFVRYFYK